MKAKPRTVSKTAQRSTAKVAKVIRAKGYPTGKLPKGLVLHHVKPVATGGKTTTYNTRVVTVAKHKQIHANRRAEGKI